MKKKVILNKENEKQGRGRSKGKEEKDELMGTKENKQRNESSLPVFRLLVDPNEILENYKKDVYKNIQLPKSKLIPVNNIYRYFLLSNNIDGGVYFNDRQDHRVILANSNHQNFLLYREGKEPLKIGGRCAWCRQDYDWPSFGIILSKDLLPIIHENQEEEKVPIFHHELDICCFQCNLAYVQHERNYITNCRDNLLVNSEHDLKILFSWIYPGKELNPAQDWKLLDKNGGPLDEKKFYDDRDVYKRTSKLILFAPARVAYLNSKK